ncbi:growth-regulating factor 1-like [Gossypium australe]|uniref:Growth-regulating factor n=1 Tax=Gossypium australe TaxID=47621 RepID=A0A5B6WEV0_9ROSI|nr:growth-regulating factor 1-like [Gossypium australe]
MDLGVPVLDGILGPENGAPSQPQPKLERSEDHCKCSMLQRSGDLLTRKTMPLHQPSPLLRSNSLVSADTGPHEHMLCFSSLNSEVPFINIKDGDFLEISTQNSGFSCYQPTPSSYTRNAGFMAYGCPIKVKPLNVVVSGYGSGCSNASMHGGFNGVRGPFTPSQWIELEHQALIYKYITSDVAVPSNLLNPLKKSLYPYGFTSSPAGSLPPNSLGWGSFHLGYSGSTDPEPERCRRTDGKKWRCSRDAVANQKYCERHINRGRHRSRKPVEGQTGHAASGTTNPKVVPMSSSMSTSVITGGGASSSLTIAQKHQFKNLQSGATHHSADALVNRIQDPWASSVMSSTTNLKSNNSTFMITKQGVPFAEFSPSDFGHVAYDSLVNLSHRSSIVESKEYGPYLDFTTDQETLDQNLLHQFFDDWPKDESIHSVITWPGELRSDWTKLSISIPMTSPEFSSSSSSPAQEKLALSPLRLSREFDPIQMGSVVKNDISDF